MGREILSSRYISSLYKATVFTFGSIKNRNIYDNFYKHLEEKSNENWIWDAETKIKAHSLFEHILGFCLVFNWLGPLKPLVTKLQKRNQNICKAYQMIDDVISELKGFRENVDMEFEHWFNFAVKLGNTVSSVPRLAKSWSRF